MTYLFYRGQCADGKLRLSRSCFYHRSYSRSGYLGCLRLQQSPFLLGPDTNSSKLLKLLLLFLLFTRGRQFQYLSCKTNIMVLQTRFANLSYLFLCTKELQILSHTLAWQLNVRVNYFLMELVFVLHQDFTNNMLLQQSLDWPR